MSGNLQKGGRILYLDMLRVLAAFGVIMIHSTAQNWHNVGYGSWAWRAMVGYNSLVRWPVSMFVMFTGILMLDPDREVDTKTIYTKRIPRLVTAYLFWSALYGVYRYCFMGYSAVDAVKHFINGNFHLYYIGVAIALYMVVPIMRPMAREKRLMEYHLVVIFFWIFLLPTAVDFLKLVNNSKVAFLVKRVETWTSSSDFLFSGLSAFYFVYGSYLHRFPVSRKAYHWSLLLGLLGAAGRWLLLVWDGTGVSTAFNFCIFDLTTVTAVFLFGKYTLSRLRLGETGERILGEISGCTFGIYLCHMLVMDGLQEIGIDTLTVHPVFSVVPHAMLVMGLSWLLVWGMRKVTVLRKYVL